MDTKNNIVVLSGGVGGARFLEGLIHVVPQEELVVIGNTGDDREFYGLLVSPDLDIVTYTLAGVVNESQGWGYKDDTYFAIGQLEKLGNESWFLLGDKDLATHIHRTNLLRQGKTLTEVTQEICHAFGLSLQLIPMSNDKIETYIKIPKDVIHFEEYFVKHRAEEKVLDVIFAGAENAVPAPGIIDAITHAKAVIFAPSNPIVSIGSILSVPGIREAIKNSQAVKIAVSPLIGNKSVKGPADNMMKDLGIEPSAKGVATLYEDFLDVFVIDEIDKESSEEIKALEIKPVVTQTLMKDEKAKIALATIVMENVKKYG